MQIINLASSKSSCISCGANLSMLGSFTYSGTSRNGPRLREEECLCRKCGARFLLKYDLFDGDGHIFSYVFNGDVNDDAYNWQDQLTVEQKKEIEEHLKTCAGCRTRLEEEILSNAWLASIFHSARK